MITSRNKFPRAACTPSECQQELGDYSFNELDLGLHKGFRLWSESSLLDIRGEAFNLLNRVNYGAPDSNRTDGSFGASLRSFPPCQLQVAAELIF